MSQTPPPAPPPGWQPHAGHQGAGYPGADAGASGTTYPGGPPPGGPGMRVWGAPVHKPGIIALRPLNLSDIYDGAFKAIRRNPKTMIGFGLLVQAAAMAIPAVVALVLAFAGKLGSSAHGNGDQFDGGIGSGSVLRSLVRTGGSLLGSLATVVLAGMLVAVVFRAVLGRRTSPGEAWRHVRGRVLALIGLTFLIGLITMIPLLVVVVAVILLVAAGSTVGAVLVGVLGAMGWFVLALFLMVKYRFATPALVLEGLGVIASMRRSWELSRGAFWRILGISILTMLIVGFAAEILGVPFQIPEMIRSVSAPDNSTAAGFTLLLTFVGLVIASAVTEPFTAGVMVLLYLDQRIRAEGYDVELIAASDPNTPEPELEPGRPLAPTEGGSSSPTHSTPAW